MTIERSKPFVNAFTYVRIGDETNSLPSQTVPEMTMSLKKLLERYTRGGQVATFTPVYTGSGEFDDNPEFEKMDAVEKLQMAKSIKDSIKAYQDRPPLKTEPKEAKKPEDELANPPEQEPEGDQKQ